MEIIANILGGLVGGLVAGFFALKAVRDGVERLEEQEIRRLKVQCVISIMSLRHILTDAADAGAPEDWWRLTAEVNKIPALFADSLSVLEKYGDFINSQNNLNLIPLIRTLLADVKVTEKQLTNTELEEIWYAKKRDATDPDATASGKCRDDS